MWSDRHHFDALDAVLQQRLVAALAVAGFAGLPDAARFLVETVVMSLLAAVPSCTKLGMVRGTFRAPS
ncbi:hypothetical protein [Paracoccus sanguinis]|uniref:Uncharacterized protein n=1 Tax=Paracoccus sanguinis TaxID=1545044 RepID=A0A099G7P2_9RHOB|nr:hypothetical protein [Paracoccus sanguinis]KGJ18755.1 hypothetical protein IX56_16585 [Paracoccus sanguinis]